MPLLMERLVDDLERTESSSADVANVVVDRCENLPILSPPVVVVWVYVDELAIDLERLWLLIEPAKKSPTDEAGRELKRLREITSNPKIDALERAVGVEGLEFLPERNSNRPY